MPGRKSNSFTRLANGKLGTLATSGIYFYVAARLDHRQEPVHVSRLGIAYSTKGRTRPGERLTCRALFGGDVSARTASRCWETRGASGDQNRPLDALATLENTEHDLGVRSDGDIPRMHHPRSALYLLLPVVTP